MMNIEGHVSLNLSVRGLEQSPTLALSEKCTELSQNGTEVFNLGIGQSPFPVPDSIVNALKQNAHERKYLPVRGLPELRKAVADYHCQRDNTDDRAEHVLIGPGSKILMFILQLVFYGEIIVPSPCWVSYIPQAKITERNVRIIDTSFKDRWHITSERLRELCESEHDTYRPRVLVLNYPGNPDGTTYTTKELKDIADVAREYEVILLSDEIYAGLDFKGEHVSVARFYPEGTIVSSGLSKWCGAGGWRLGTFTFPEKLEWLMDAMAIVGSQTYTSVSSPIQYAAITAFRGGEEIENNQWHARRILSAVGQECARILKDADVFVHPPEGAFYLFPDFSLFAEHLEMMGITDSKTMCERLLQEKHIATIPGVSFGRPPEELTARMAYTNFDGAKAMAASEAIPSDEDLPDDFPQRWCGKTIEATKGIVDWVTTGA